MKIKLYLFIFILNFGILFAGVFLAILFAQVFIEILYWLIGENNPQQFSLLWSAKLIVFPSLIYGLAGIYSQWSSDRKSKGSDSIDFN